MTRKDTSYKSNSSIAIINISQRSSVVKKLEIFSKSGKYFILRKVKFCSCSEIGFERSSCGSAQGIRYCSIYAVRISRATISIESSTDLKFIVGCRRTIL